ncbi:MAG: S1/P1 nuclease [Xanthomonadaceae bacterium]|nr:S1/P1 nuclease [Xanthomonadaceae bacterium]
MHRRRQPLPLALFACALLAAAPAALAWGPLGHRIVADLAASQLAPATRAEVDRLLASEHAASLADVANWADRLRDDPALAELGKATAPLHYVNMHGRCVYRAAEDCPDGRCVVHAINHYAAILGDRGLPIAERAQALNFVVHFVADAQQPLHAGYRDDKGGNEVQVQFDGQGSNLHRVWDSGLLSTRDLDDSAYAALLEREGPLALPKPIAPFDNAPAQWVEQSCRIVRDGGVYPSGRRIDAAYVARMRPIAEHQLRLGGARLAALLDRVLGGAPATSAAP